MGLHALLGHTLQGRYRLDTSLGEGGFAQVFRAYDLRLKRVVAIKVLKPELVSPKIVGRFEQEAQLTAHLAGAPHTVLLHDYGQERWQNTELLFMVTEYVDGTTLSQYLRQRGPLPQLLVAQLLRQILQSLQAAHRQGVLHRDVKSPNVMVYTGPEGHELCVKVLDYGIGKVMDGGDGEGGPTPSGFLTTNDEFNGTISYCPPEQILRQRELFGPPTDLYAVGMIGYELLTGQHPYVGLDAGSILRRAISPEPLRLPARLAGSPLAPIVHKLLAKDISARYAEAGEAIEDVEQLRLGDAPPAAPASTPITDETERLDALVKYDSTLPFEPPSTREEGTTPRPGLAAEARRSPSAAPALVDLLETTPYDRELRTPTTRFERPETQTPTPLPSTEAQGVARLGERGAPEADAPLQRRGLRPLVALALTLTIVLGVWAASSTPQSPQAHPELDAQRGAQTTRAAVETATSATLMGATITRAQHTIRTSHMSAAARAAEHTSEVAEPQPALTTSETGQARRAPRRASPTHTAPHPRKATTPLKRAADQARPATARLTPTDQTPAAASAAAVIGQRVDGARGASRQASPQASTKTTRHKTTTPPKPAAPAKPATTRALDEEFTRWTVGGGQ